MRRWQRQWLRGGTMRSAAVRSYQQVYRKLSRRRWELAVHSRPFRQCLRLWLTQQRTKWLHR